MSRPFATAVDVALWLADRDDGRVLLQMPKSRGLKTEVWNMVLLRLAAFNMPGHE